MIKGISQITNKHHGVAEWFYQGKPSRYCSVQKYGVKLF